MSNPANYAPGTYAYQRNVNAYGKAGADYVWQTAREGGDVGAALTGLAVQSTGSASFLGNFATQITTDPLAAPLESANNQIENVVKGLFKNPWVLLALALVIFHLLGGFNLIQRKLATA